MHYALQNREQGMSIEENAKWVKEHIQQAAGNDADHAIRRQALEAQEVVH